MYNGTTRDRRHTYKTQYLHKNAVPSSGIQSVLSRSFLHNLFIRIRKSRRKMGQYKINNTEKIIILSFETDTICILQFHITDTSTCCIIGIRQVCESRPNVGHPRSIQSGQNAGTYLLQVTCCEHLCERRLCDCRRCCHGDGRLENMVRAKDIFCSHNQIS